MPPSPLSDQQQRNLIAQELGMLNDTAFLQYLADKWPLFDGYAQINFHLRYLYVKREAIHYLIGQVRTNRDWKMADVIRKDSQLVTNMQKMLEDIKDEIKDIMGPAQARAPKSGKVAAGTLKQGTDKAPPQLVP